MFEHGIIRPERHQSHPFAQIPLPVRNFTTDWNDGRALGALVNSVAPGLTPDWERWQPVQKVRNVTVAMDRADEYLGVTKVRRLCTTLTPLHTAHRTRRTH